MVFIMDHGGGLGHTGMVEKVAGGVLTTIEGNTDASMSREGGGVYRLTRKITDINKGFIRLCRRDMRHLEMSFQRLTHVIFTLITY